MWHRHRRSHGASGHTVPGPVVNDFRVQADSHCSIPSRLAAAPAMALSLRPGKGLNNVFKKYCCRTIFSKNIIVEQCFQILSSASRVKVKLVRKNEVCCGEKWISVEKKSIHNSLSKSSSFYQHSHTFLHRDTGHTTQICSLTSFIMLESSWLQLLLKLEF